MYIKRAVEAEVQAALDDTPVVVVTGPRQAGKTTLVKHMLADRGSYLTLDDENTLLQATEDPIGLLRGLAKPVAIDEVQRAPELIRTVKLLVDEERTPGAYVLTGSADLMAVPKLADSLAGRCEFITLWPFSQAELAAEESTFLSDLRAGVYSAPRQVLSQTDLMEVLVSGGYPEALKRTPRRRTRWYEDYEHAIIQRDIQEVFQINKVTELRHLLEMLAALSSELYAPARLANDLALSHKSVDKYVAALESLFLVKRLPAWHQNALKRVIKQSKLHFVDTGLLCAIRGIDAAGLARDRNLLGNLLETFVYSELQKLIAVQPTPHTLYHYRDKDKKEVDFILSPRGQAAIGIEIKASMTVKADMFKHLDMLSDKGVIQQSIVLYTGDQVVTLGEGKVALPVSCLM